MKLSIGVHKIVLSVILTPVLACSAASQTSTTSASLPEDNAAQKQTQMQSGADAHELAKKLSNPVASLISLVTSRSFSLSRLRSHVSLPVSRNPDTGTFGRGAVVYGPSGGAGGFAAYDPRTGTYARGGAVYGPYVSQHCGYCRDISCH